MGEAYDEIIDGERLDRRAPSAAHDLLVSRLHRLVADCLPLNSALRLHPPQTGLILTDHVTLRPDLTLLRAQRAPGATAETYSAYLVAEVLQPGDHHLDTVVKKQIYADRRLPRLWMVDPRYLNVEVYAAGEYGFTLLDILANHHPLTDPHLPGLKCPMHTLFAGL
jgi:Uma2 family endonuclease